MLQATEALPVVRFEISDFDHQVYHAAGNHEFTISLLCESFKNGDERDGDSPHAPTVLTPAGEGSADRALQRRGQSVLFPDPGAGHVELLVCLRERALQDLILCHDSP